MGNEMPYSYHTFMFPFLWKNRGGEMKTMEDFIDLIPKNGDVYWHEIEKIAQMTNNKDDYAVTQYFKRDAARILYNTDDNGDTVRYYRYHVMADKSDICKFARVTEKDEPKGKYIIHKGDAVFTYDEKGERNLKKYDPFRYELDINQITLAVYSTGIAILRLELEYWGNKIYDKQEASTGCINFDAYISRTVDDVNAINEYGRRTTLPFAAEFYDALVADKIEIKFKGVDGNGNLCEDFKGKLDDFHSQPDEDDSDKNKLNTHYIMKPLRYLLSPDMCFASDYKNAVGSKKRYFIEPIMDDRMYVCCIVRDNGLTKRFQKKDDNGEYEVFLSEEVYKLGFIETSMSCQSTRMRSEILHRCIYDRWIDWGTIDIITHHSFVRLTGSSAPEHIITAFLTEYIKMAELVLAQRATLIALENECVVSQSDLKKMYELQELYVNARKTLLLEECTTQEQGIEEFKMLREELFVNEQADSLDKRLNDLLELKNLHHAKRQEWFGNAIAGLGAFMSIIEIIKLICNWK